LEISTAARYGIAPFVSTAIAIGKVNNFDSRAGGAFLARDGSFLEGPQGRLTGLGGDPKPGVVQNSAFPSRNRQIRNPMGKTRGKTTRKSAKSGEKWRFFETLKRHFAVLGAEVAQAQAIHFQGFRSVEPGWCDPPRFPRIGCMAPFSNRARYKPTTLRWPGEGRSDLTRGARLRQKRYNG